jgi:phage integrase family site-specific recombinase
VRKLREYVTWKGDDFMPRITRIDGKKTIEKSKKKVAAYARVSMETDMLHHSLSVQINYYSTLIQNNPDWEYVGVYADEGITGRNTKHRDEFNRLIEDSKNGKIDMILVKSISRFARNTVDLLNTVRELKAVGINVYFERENINSISNEGELLLTLLASFAQEESRSTSENVKWGIRKNFEKGIANSTKAPYGYRWDGEKFRIIKDQAEIVKEIFRRYLDGESAYSIAKNLAEHGVRGQTGNPIEQTSVKLILANPSYTGTRLLQKYYISENQTRKRNKGELPMYLVDDMYEPIISEEVHEKALEIMKKRAESMPNKNPKLTPISGLVKCGVCGGGISRRKSSGRWICNTRERKGKTSCTSRPILEKELKKAAMKIMGEENFSRHEFRNKVEKVIVYGDRIDFILCDGGVSSIKREYSGERGSNPYFCKIYCSNCGDILHRAKWSSEGKVWICSKTCGECSVRHIKENEIFEASKHFLGEDYNGKVVEYIDKIYISNEEAKFIFKDGTVKIWQRK